MAAISSSSSVGRIPIQVQYGFQGNTANGELTFPSGAIINIITEETSDTTRFGWIKGQYQNYVGYFPLAFVPSNVAYQIQQQQQQWQQQHAQQQNLQSIPTPTTSATAQQHLLSPPHQQDLLRFQPPLQQQQPFPAQFQRSHPSAAPQLQHLVPLQQQQRQHLPLPSFQAPQHQQQQKQKQQQQQQPIHYQQQQAVQMRQEVDSHHPRVDKPQGKKTATAKSKYAKNQMVWYIKNNKKHKAKILKIHLDDELIPYYDIELMIGDDRIEKQTDDGHLQPLEGEDEEEGKQQQQQEKEAADVDVNDYVHIPSIMLQSHEVVPSSTITVGTANSESNSFAAYPTTSQSSTTTGNIMEEPSNPFDAFDDLVLVNAKTVADNEKMLPPPPPLQPPPPPPPTSVPTIDLLDISTVTPTPQAISLISENPPPQVAKTNEEDLVDLSDSVIQPQPSGIAGATNTGDATFIVDLDTASTSTNSRTENPFDLFDPLSNKRSETMSSASMSISSSSLGLLDDFTMDKQSEDDMLEKQYFSCSDLLNSGNDDSDDDDDDIDNDFGFEIMGGPPGGTNIGNNYNPWLMTSNNDSDENSQEANRRRIHSLTMVQPTNPVVGMDNNMSVSDDEQAKKKYHPKVKKKKKKKKSKSLLSVKNQATTDRSRPKGKKGSNSKTLQTQAKQQQQRKKLEQPSGSHENAENRQLSQVPLSGTDSNKLRKTGLRTISLASAEVSQPANEQEGDGKLNTCATEAAVPSSAPTIVKPTKGSTDDAPANGTDEKRRIPPNKKKKKRPMSTVPKQASVTKAQTRLTQNTSLSALNVGAGESSAVSATKATMGAAQAKNGDSVGPSSSIPQELPTADSETSAEVIARKGEFSVPSPRRKAKSFESEVSSRTRMKRDINKEGGQRSRELSRNRMYRKSNSDKELLPEGVSSGHKIEVASAPATVKKPDPTSSGAMSNSKEGTIHSFVRRSLVQIDHAIVNPVSDVLSNKEATAKTKDSSAEKAAGQTKSDGGIRSLVRRSLLQIDHVIVDPVAAAAKKITERQQPQPQGQQESLTKAEKRSPNASKQRKQSLPTRSKSAVGASSIGIADDNPSKPSLRRVGSVTLPKERRKAHRRTGSVPNMKTISGETEEKVGSRKSSIRRVSSAIPSRKN